MGRSTAETLSLMETKAITFLRSVHERNEPEVSTFLADEKKLEHFRYLIWECFDRYTDEKYSAYLREKTDKFGPRDLILKAIALLESLDESVKHAINREYVELDLDYFENKMITPLEDAALFLDGQVRSRAGRRPYADLEIPLDVLMSALELAFGRKFRRNYKIEKGGRGFLHPDAELMTTILKQMDPKITSAMVKTVLKSYPARRRREGQIT